MKRSVLALLVATLLIGGAGYAWAGTRSAAGPPLPAKPTDLPGNQAQVQVHGAAPRAIGTQNGVTQREYVPLPTPCRLYDSRFTGAGRFGTNEVRTIPRTACAAIPASATALDASISAIAPTHAGYLRAWAADATEPNQTVLQWGASANTAGATITMSSTGVKVHSYNGPTHVAIDVAGYYQPAIYADVLTASTTAFADMYSSTNMISGYSSALTSPGEIVIDVRRDVTYCDIQATAEAGTYTASAIQYSGTRVAVRLRDAGGNPVRAYASVVITC